VTHGGWDRASALAELGWLGSPGVIGFYTNVEVTEVVAFRPAQPPVQPPVNVLAIVVAEGRTGAPDLKSRFLNTERIKLKELPGWTFGVMRYVLPFSALPMLLNDCVDGGSWSGSGHPWTIRFEVPWLRDLRVPGQTDDFPS
jgi:hypothetical protein